LKGTSISGSGDRTHVSEFGATQNGRRPSGKTDERKRSSSTFTHIVATRERKKGSGHQVNSKKDPTVVQRVRCFGGPTKWDRDGRELGCLLAEVTREFVISPFSDKCLITCDSGRWDVLVTERLTKGRRVLILKKGYRNYRSPAPQLAAPQQKR